MFNDVDGGYAEVKWMSLFGANCFVLVFGMVKMVKCGSNFRFFVVKTTIKTLLYSRTMKLWVDIMD